VSAFSALTLLVGRQEGHLACKKQDWWGTGVVICLERGAVKNKIGGVLAWLSVWSEVQTCIWPS